MKLTVLGKYGPFAVNGGATSGYMLSGENTNCLLDLGAGTLSRAMSKIELKNINFIILSHLHYDHISDLGVLTYAMNFLRKGEKIDIYYPSDNSLVANFIENSKCFNGIKIEENKTYTSGEFTFSFIRTNHPVLTYATKIESEGKIFVYTGDTNYFNGLYGFVKNANLTLVDGAFLEKDYSAQKPHLSIKLAGGLSNYSNGKVIVTHQHFNYTDSEVEEELKEFKNTVLAKENETYEF